MKLNTPSVSTSGRGNRKHDCGRASCAAPRLSQYRKVSGTCLAQRTDTADLAVRAQEMVASTPEVMESAQRLAAAEERVARLKAQQLELQSGPTAGVENPSSSVSVSSDLQQAMAEVASINVLAAQARLEESQLQAELLEKERSKLQAAFRQNAERVESAKAATVAGLGGFLGAVPYALLSGGSAVGSVVSVGGSIVTCALFGIVYRYAIASDPENGQLRAGVVAAFGIARALPQLEATLSSSTWNAEIVATLALISGQSLLTVGFGALVLEGALSRGVVAPYGHVQADKAATDETLT